MLEDCRHLTRLAFCEAEQEGVALAGMAVAAVLWAAKALKRMR
jgi:hypothetical protein